MANLCLGESNESKDLKHAKELITVSFETQNCYFFTYPGDKIKLIAYFYKLCCSILGRVVDTGKVNNCKYDGNFGEMDSDFKDDLFKFIKLELKPDNLNTKKLYGRNITGSEFLNYIESVIEHYQLYKTFNDDLNNYEFKIKNDPHEINNTTEMSLSAQNEDQILNHNHSRSFLVNDFEHIRIKKPTEHRKTTSHVNSCKVERKLSLFKNNN